MLIALLLLFCLNLSMYQAPVIPTKMEEFFARSCRRRVIIFKLSLDATVIVTLAVLITLVAKILLWKA
jgi:hypothetical protein